MIKLIEALARRKELQEKVNQLKTVQPNVLTKEVHQVKGIQDRGVDGLVADIVASVPRVSTEQITHAYDWHAKQLRKIDIAIQQANHVTDVAVDAEVMSDYVDPYFDKE